MEVEVENLAGSISEVLVNGSLATSIDLKYVGAEDSAKLVGHHPQPRSEVSDLAELSERREVCGSDRGASDFRR